MFFWPRLHPWSIGKCFHRGDCIVNRLAYATARSRLPMNGKNGSAEHLYELIRVCLLMQRHKDFILAQKRLIANAQKFAQYMIFACPLPTELSQVEATF
jgi:hypothetical protein